MNGIVFIGLQASGKSSFYLNQFYKTHIRLNMDMLKTRNRERILFNACLEGKQPTVIDNTNPTKEDREKYIKGFKENRFEVVGYYFASKLSDCLERNAARKGKERIPDVGIKTTYNKLELPEYTEGFDKLFYVSIRNDGFDVKEWNDEV
ncbi:AAA family ATPase [Gynuella sunshinyii]|uniref:Putative kinase n=1 Tax=Gynuella sunshinyii YC6258 TaxID=1445510 RepID=A0A0C5V880_9GAMM|nr:AAA family ATPase [Gynuella sunshinyii]AJQ95605.1 putative kinase [Gynuella sunshinyii YC6258]